MSTAYRLQFTEARVLQAFSKETIKAVLFGDNMKAVPVEPQLG